MQRGGETGPTIEDVRDWVEEQEEAPGYQVFTDAEIAASVVQGNENDSDSDIEEDIPVKKVKLSTLRTYVDALLDYTTYSSLAETSSHYGNLRML